jgi:hypothetical protein
MLTGGLALIGCSHGIPPTDLISQTETTVKEVERPDAMQVAPLEVKEAREHLDLAKKAMTDQNYILARRLAEKSMADAHLARAKTNAEKTKTTADESTKTIETLRQETNRNLPQ